MPIEKKKKRPVVSCPLKLQEFIDLANFSESKLELYNFNTNLRGYAKNQGLHNLSDKQVIEWFQEQLKSEPKKIRDFILEPMKSFSGEKKQFRTADARLLWLIEQKFSTMYSIQQILGRMAFSLWEDSEGKIHSFQNKEPREFSTPISVFIDEDGFFRVVINELFNLMNEVNITAYRLRRCFVCNRIFWANRIDSYSCKKSCANTIRQRMWLERNREEYNKKRQSNRAYKKRIETIKKDKEK